MLVSAKLRYKDLLKELEFNAKQARNNLSISQSLESDFVVISEMDGKVYSLNKEPGEMVTPPNSIGGATIFYWKCKLMNTI